MERVERRGPTPPRLRMPLTHGSCGAEEVPGSVRTLHACSNSMEVAASSAHASIPAIRALGAFTDRAPSHSAPRSWTWSRIATVTAPLAAPPDGISV